MREICGNNLEKFSHVPVLLNECIEGLKINPCGIYVDGTLGGAGHSLKIIENLQNDGLLIGIDRDIDAISVAKEKLKNYNNVKYVNDNHDNIKQILQDLRISKVDGILLDLGVSSFQLDEETRGFSYIKDAPLDMRMDKNQELTAREVVNRYSEERLANIIYEYGEEKFSRNIARNICACRNRKFIETTGELSEIIEKSIPGFAKHKSQGHPAKRTFQAIRIEVNNELEPLFNTVMDCINSLKNGGRLCVITFHSLEDRIVKKAYTNATGICTCPSDLPYCVCNKQEKGIIINKKPILPTEEEQEKNGRSKSAKLRIFERI